MVVFAHAAGRDSRLVRRAGHHSHDISGASAADRVPVRLGDVARIQIGAEMRRGIAELNGEGEVAGGIIVMRSCKNALETIEAVKAKLAPKSSACRHDRRI